MKYKCKRFFAKSTFLSDRLLLFKRIELNLRYKKSILIIKPKCFCKILKQHTIKYLHYLNL